MFRRSNPETVTPSEFETAGCIFEFRSQQKQDETGCLRDINYLASTVVGLKGLTISMNCLDHYEKKNIPHTHLTPQNTSIGVLSSSHAQTNKGS